MKHTHINDETINIYRFTCTLIETINQNQNSNKINCNMSYLMNPDEFVTCPYDSNHRVQVHRLQMHILKCKKV